MAPPRASRPLEGALGSHSGSGVRSCTSQAGERKLEGAVGRLAQELGRGTFPGATGEFSSQLELDLGLKVQQRRISRRQFSEVQPTSRWPSTAKNVPRLPYL